jgi:hypothetical protein
MRIGTCRLRRASASTCRSIRSTLTSSGHHALGRTRSGAGRHRRGAGGRPHGSSSTRWHSRISTSTKFPNMLRWAHGRGMDLTVIETMPMGEIDGRPHRPVSAAVEAARRSREAVHTDRHSLQDRRPGALRRGRGDRRPARLHHADDPQFLRKLQSRPPHLHRHALHVPRPERRRGPAHGATRLGRTMPSFAAIDEAIGASRRATISSSTAAPARPCPPHERHRRLSPQVRCPCCFTVLYSGHKKRRGYLRPVVSCKGEATYSSR